MIRSSRLGYTVRIVTVMALLTGQQVIAAPPVEQAPQVEEAASSVDVALSEGGVLQGYVVDAQGVPAMGIEVKLTAPDGQMVSTISDHKGRFGYRGLAGAAYQLETENGVVACRAWTAEAAPPRAATSLLVVHDDTLVRGQWSAPPMVNHTTGRLKRAFTNPFFVATVVGAAIAIPVAIHNANDDSSS
ncbi:carboxypeptidase-like regulatory domain-containing protein [Aeoliella mucimassa]|uniref:Nickel uptake substrate-specific transmembrane region n=1 Tax=Aeoliella mucimassa TaxID=2527972 RepID=A0A518ARS0_9BACT|nr:carboxypeptidase-like regulatory domain-containing protein [Aeoliella mucimassa]QDU57414.1 hypothetical protein Pan181_36300 [Aeoliella mucimassa]